MYTSYEELLKRDMDSFKSYGLFYDMAIKYVPAFFKLLCEILDMSDITFESRIRINCAIAYLIIPNDALPETIYGAEGYMDDLFVMVYVLKELFLKHKDVMKAQWSGILSRDGGVDLEKTLNECHAVSLKVLNERGLLSKTLELAGLKKA